jgi:hypothetical protein
MDISCKYGFRTTENSKWQLINETQLALADHGLIINDLVTIAEFMNFVYQQTKRKAGAADGFNDDTVMALMLAHHGALLYPFTRPVIETKKKPVIDADATRAWRQFRKKLLTSKSKEGIIL